MARKVKETSGNIAVQIIVPGGKNVVKVLPLRDALLKIARAMCVYSNGPCRKCTLNKTLTCETLLFDEGYIEKAVPLLNALFDGQLAKVAIKQGWKL